MKDDGFNYLGTLDDVVERYPWRFALNKRRLEFSLVVQLINGRPILLNDGYLIQNQLAIDAIQNENSLLWAMIRSGFVRILARGGDLFGLHELPERMKHVPTIEARSKMPDWQDFSKRLKLLDFRLREEKHLLAWPSLDAGSGYRELAKHLQSVGSTPRSLGIGSAVRKDVWRSFLAQFVDRMSTDTGAARSYWENLAQLYGNDPDNTKNSNEFVRALMNLANEMYHYNFGIMLASEYDVPVSVETQSSAAFDDLIVRPKVLVSEIYGLPKLHVPSVILNVPPHKLIRVLDLDTKVGEARKSWLLSRFAYESGAKVDREELNYAAKRYSRELSAAFGKDISYKESEGLLKYVVGQGATSVRDFANSMIGGAAGLTYIQEAAGIPGMGPAIGWAAGYGLSKLQNWGVGLVTAKYKVAIFEKNILPPQAIQESERIINNIKFRRVPSSILMDRPYSQVLVGKMDRFDN